MAEHIRRADLVPSDQGDFNPIFLKVRAGRDAQRLGRRSRPQLHCSAGRYETVQNGATGPYATLGVTLTRRIRFLPWGEHLID